MKRSLFFLFIASSICAAQEPDFRPSIHELQNRLYAGDRTPALRNVSPAAQRPPALGKKSALTRKVLGWHPYWVDNLDPNAYLYYDYTALSHIAYFSYETDTATGGYVTIRDWMGTPIVEQAHAWGVKVVLTVTNFGYQRNIVLLSDTNKQNTMISNLITLLKARNGDGVNFDLESIDSTQRAHLVFFMQKAAQRIKAQIPAAEISMAAPAVDWRKGWDLAQLGQICDYLIVMGYDYYWSGSTTAGPVAPLVGRTYCVSNSITYYLNAGVPSSRLWLGVPWYGYDFHVVSNARMAPTVTGSVADARTYTVAQTMAQVYGKSFDDTYKVPWFGYFNNEWRQVWYDDSLSLAMKYSLVNAQNLGGIGIWALSYDGRRNEIWTGIKGAFTPTGIAEEPPAVPAECRLEQNYPNPFNPSTTIAVQLPERQRVTLQIFDLLGRRVALLHDGELGAGYHRFEWNATGYSSGVYLCTMHAAMRTHTRTMVLMR